MWVEVVVLRFCVLVTITSVRLIRMQESWICSTIFEAFHIVVARQTSMNFFQLFASCRRTDIKGINVFKSTNLRCWCKSCQHSILVSIITMFFRNEFQIGVTGDVATLSELLKTTFGVISLSKLSSNSPLNMFWFPCPYATGIAGVTGNTGGRGRTNDTLGAAGNE